MTRPAKPKCIYCGQDVLVSKQRSTEMNLHPVTGEVATFRAHNDCVDAANETASMARLIEACNGDLEQALRVRAVLLAAPGSLATRRIR